MNDAELQRYSRHILLPQIDIAGQEKLSRAGVLLLGVGGLGSPVAMYLAASGVGHLTIVDPDTVELTNLQRQIVHTTSTLGIRKVESAKQQLEKLNPTINIDVVGERLDGAALDTRIQQADIVVDATDNFASRFAINAACVRARKPLVSGAIVRFEGQVAVFAPGGPCYRCLYPDTGDAPDEPCSQFGVFAPAVGVVGSLQAAETLKLLIGIGTSLAGRLLLYDALRAEWREVRLRKDPHCPVCSS